MNITTKTMAAAIVALTVLGGLATASSAFAATATSTAAQTARAAAQAARLSSQESKIVARANQEIARRIDGLNALASRIDAMKKVSDSDKASLASTTEEEIANLTALKAKIDADTDITTLRADVKSVVTSYRIYALVIPQGHLLAAVDSVNATADAYTALATKLQTRVTAAQTAGKDVTAMTAALSDIGAKIADARSEASAAEVEIVGLKPDNGDKTLMASNTAALKDARSKIKATMSDFKAARKDAVTVITTLRSENGRRDNKEASTTKQ